MEIRLGIAPIAWTNNDLPQLGGGDPTAAHAERPEYLVELFDHAGPAPALGISGTLAERAAEPFGERVTQGTAGERDAEERLSRVSDTQPRAVAVGQPQ